MRKLFSVKIEEALTEKIQSDYQAQNDIPTKGEFVEMLLTRALTPPDPAGGGQVDELQARLTEAENENIRLTNKVNHLENKLLASPVIPSGGLFVQFTDQQSREFWAVVQLMKQQGYCSGAGDFIFHLLDDYRRDFNAFLFTPEDEEYLKSLSYEPGQPL